MKPEERILLKQFLDDLAATRGAVKDPEADRMITEAVRSNPDAAYVLVQHAILSDRAIKTAQIRITELEQELNTRSSDPREAPSFLGSSPWTMGRGQRPQAGGQPDDSGLFSANSGLGGFLRSAGTMAAGVAGGAFLFQGLSNLFGHGTFGGYGGDRVTINEFHSDGGSDGSGFLDSDFDGGDFGGGDFGGDV